MVVEDDVVTSRTTAAILSNAGFAVDEAADGERALEKIAQRRPDLILLDMVMPGMTGWAFLRRLVEGGDVPPVIVVSGRYASPEPLGTLDAYVRAYVPKPFNMVALVQTCRRVLDAAAAAFARVSQQERRQHRRRTLLLDVEVLSEENTVVAKGVVTDLSLSGAQIEVGVRLRVGDVLRLALDLPGQPEPLRAPAEVRWRNEGLTGVAFIDLSDQAQGTLRAFLAPPGLTSPDTGAGP